MTQTVLLAGATGMLGSQITRHLLEQPEARIRLLVRGADAGKRAALDTLLGRGAETVEGDLAEAGRRNGVRRILPSDFALDLFKATPGEHMMFDLRRTADERIAATGLEHVHIL